MMELDMGAAACAGEDGSSLTLQYSLLVDEITDGGFFAEDYGIKVTSSDGTQAQVRHITPDQTHILQLLALLRENEVSPIHLQDIIEDQL